MEGKYKKQSDNSLSSKKHFGPIPNTEIKDKKQTQDLPITYFSNFALSLWRFVGEEQARLCLALKK